MLLATYSMQSGRFYVAVKLGMDLQYYCILPLKLTTHNYCTLNKTRIEREQHPPKICDKFYFFPCLPQGNSKNGFLSATRTFNLLSLMSFSSRTSYCTTTAWSVYMLPGEQEYCTSDLRTHCIISVLQVLFTQCILESQYFFIKLTLRKYISMTSSSSESRLGHVHPSTQKPLLSSLRHISLFLQQSRNMKL